MKKLVLILLPIFTFILLACSGETEEKNFPEKTETEVVSDVIQKKDETEPKRGAQYEVVERKDISFAGVERLTFKVLTSTSVSKGDLEQITGILVEDENESFGEITIWFYDDKEDIPYSYTVAMAIYTAGEDVEYTFKEEKF